MRRWFPAALAIVMVGAIAAGVATLVAGNKYEPLQVVMQVPDNASALDPAASPMHFRRSSMTKGDVHEIALVIENTGRFAVTLYDLGTDLFDGYFLLDRPVMRVAPVTGPFDPSRAVSRNSVRIRSGERRLLVVATRVRCTLSESLGGSSTIGSIDARQQFGPFEQPITLDLPVWESFPFSTCKP
ncbi:MAG TPA: hypothetical protein VNB24_00485 [Acidimicrobiales bacterium]|nr:hypothetical protein [Acidimicrobiales bacterium]